MHVLRSGFFHFGFMEGRNWNLYRPIFRWLWLLKVLLLLSNKIICKMFCILFYIFTDSLLFNNNRKQIFSIWIFFILFRWMWLFGVLLLLSNNKSSVLFYVAITYCYWTTAGTYPNAFCTKVNINFIVQMSISFCQACCVCSNNNEFLIIRYVNPNIIQN